MKLLLETLALILLALFMVASCSENGLIVNLNDKTYRLKLSD